jgi:hypothetical protein
MTELQGWLVIMWLAAIQLTLTALLNKAQEK